jgi:transposase-like protein
MARETREEWAKRVERWRDSGLTAAEFAAEVGVNPRTLSYWKWRLGSKRGRSLSSKPTKARSKKASRSAARKKAAALAVRPLSFVEVTKATSALSGEPFEVELVSGERIRIPSSFDASSLSRLLDVLGRSR